LLEGRLSSDQPGVSYSFTTASAQTLHWHASGPAMRIVLTSPNGEADGPGLPAEISLGMPGRYVLSVSANTMADKAYGAFRMELRLSPRR